MAFGFFKAVADYEIAYANPVVFNPGDRVKVLRGDPGWPGWVWVRTSTGNEGWAPRRALDEQGEYAVARTDYNGVELSARAGERLEAIQEESGWVWCRKQDGGEGWFPLFNLVPEND